MLEPRLDERAAARRRCRLGHLGWLIALAALAAVATTATATEPRLKYGSCRDYCGQRWETTHYTGTGGALEDRINPARTYRDGCSCEPDCGYHGTCCPDVAEECTGIDAAPIPPGIQQTDIAAIGAMHYEGMHQRSVIIDDGSTVAGLTRINLAEIDSQGEHSRCRISTSMENVSVAPCPSEAGCDPPDLPYWMVEASTDYDDNGALCEALGVRFPGPVTSDEYDIQQTRQGDSKGAPSMTSAVPHSVAGWFPLMTRARMEDVDSVGEKSRCRVYPGNDGVWHIEAWANWDDNDAWCSFRFVDAATWGAAVESTCPSPSAPLAIDRLEWSPAGANPGGGDWSAGCEQSNGVAIFHAYANAQDDDPRRTTRISLMPEATHACFLSMYQIEDVDTSKEPADCVVNRNDGKYWLQAEAQDDSDTWCQAMCMALPTSETTQPTTDGWPPLPNHRTELTLPGTSDPVYLELYQSGTYDAPIVFFEGFDPVNNNSIAYHERLLGPVLQQLRDQGYDVWMVDLADGGQPVVQTARQNAVAVDYAYHYLGWDTANPDRKLVTVGISMGALAGRFMLASWEDGDYTSVSSPEFISQGLGRDGEPPVSIHIAINGPQDGASIPLALQEVVQDIGSFFNLGEAYEALNSAAATNMLYKRYSNSCKRVVTENCSGGLVCQIVGALVGASGSDTLKNGTTNVNGTECDSSSIVTGCIRYGWDWSSFPPTWACLGGTTATHDAFYADVNSRGPAGDGHPGDVVTVGLSNGSWQPQGCGSMQPGLDCAGPDAFAVGSELGSIRFVDVGHTILSCCDRNSTILGHLTGTDLMPGDLSGRSINDSLSLGLLPKQVTDFVVDQNFPFVFVPTESALQCVGATSDAECAAISPFDQVASNPDYNGTHDSLQPALMLDLLGLLWDGLHADGDGVCGDANPYAPFCIRSGDCDDGDAAVGTTGTDSCTTSIGGPGEMSCQDGVWGECVALDYCDGIDVDGDGQDGEDEPDLGAGCSVPGEVGACVAGSWSCDAGAMVCTGPSATTEVCNNRDDDCDGAIDEWVYGGSCSPPPSYPNGVLCKPSGIQRCSFGGWVCVPKETCGNHLDDDCDGLIDENCAPPCQSCFVAGTRIAMADGTQRPIEEVVPGEHVLSYDVETGKVVSAEVTATFVHDASGPILRINGTLEATPNHPFWANGEWIRADLLTVGDALLALDPLPGGPLAFGGVVEGIETLPGDVPTFNLEVDTHHNYFAEGILVHNKSSCTPPPPEPAPVVD